jgi:hypothetical protein
MNESKLITTSAQVITSIRQERLLDYLTGHRLLLLPKGTRLLGVWIETEWNDGIEQQKNGRIVLRLAHESFPPTPDGCPIPGGRAAIAARLNDLGTHRHLIARAKVEPLEPDQVISKAKVPFQKYRRRRIIEVEEEELS